jgi:hypothetical protein
MFKNEKLREFELVNNNKVEKYQSRRRLYIFVIPTQNLSVSAFNLESIFEPSSDESEDLASLRNSI